MTTVTDVIIVALLIAIMFLLGLAIELPAIKDYYRKKYDKLLRDYIRRNSHP